MHKIGKYDIILLYIINNLLFMKINTKIFLILFFTCFTYVSSVNAAYYVKQEASGMGECSYNIKGYNQNGQARESGWKVSSKKDCSAQIDFADEGIGDGIYKLHFKSEDLSDAPNQMTGESNDLYRVDTTPVKCKFTSLTINGIENAYYNQWKFYYRSNTNASGSFDIKFYCEDTSTPNARCFWERCISWIQEINFPSILWASPIVSEVYGRFNTNGGLVGNTTLDNTNVNVRYNWSGNQTQTFEILSQIINNDSNTAILDLAGNWAVFETPNIQLIIKDDDGDTIDTIPWVTNVTLTPDGNAPTFWDIQYTWGNLGGWAQVALGTNPYLAALTNRQISLPSVSDGTGAGLRSFNMYIEKYNDASKYETYPASGSKYQWSTLTSKVSAINPAVITHNFKDVNVQNGGDFDSNNWYRPYSWWIQSYGEDGKVYYNQICDMVGNCSTPVWDTFKIVANEPDKNETLATSETNFNSRSWKLSDGTQTHHVYVAFKDQYGNRIIPVSWVKNVVLTNDFINSLWKDQLHNPYLWDGVEFSFTPDLNPQSGKEYQNFSWIIGPNDSDFKDGEIDIQIRSVVPTYSEYDTASNHPGAQGSLYGNSLTAQLKYKTFKIKVNPLSGRSWVGEYESSNDFLWRLPSFYYDPVLSYDYIDNIYPLLEWQEKTLEIKSDDHNKVDWFSFDVRVGTNNPFLQFDPNSFNRNENNRLSDIVFFPKTAWWIMDANTEVGLYSTLRYFIKGKEVFLPGIQSGLRSFGFVPDLDSDPDKVFEDENNYKDDSDVIFAEVEITWITQTDNELWNNAWGEAVTTDNDTFNDFSKISLFEIKTDINRNVSQILKWVNREDGKVWNTKVVIDDLNDFSSFDSNAVVLKEGNVIYVKDNNVSIKCSSNNSCWVLGKKTIIVEGGNLTIDSDLYYENANSILWIILIGNEDNGNTSQLRINENITNGVWIVYSEWPVVSVDNSWTIYNGSNVGDSLYNQLHWQGSFITRNTVGWAIKTIDISKACPYGTPEYDTNACTREVAQWYDLIYLRRYARVNDSYYGITSPMWDSKVPISCDTRSIKIAWWITIGSWCMSMNSGNNKLTKDPTNYNAPLIVEFDPQVQSNPPFGFEK